LGKLRDAFWTPTPPWSTVRAWVVPRFFEAWHCALVCTWRISSTGFSRGMPLALEKGEGALLVCWHDKTLVPLHFVRDLNFAGMISTSRAGQLQGAFWARYGWRIVWGSTKKRQGILALREAMRLLREGQSFAFTPDGPKGPRHKAQGGIVYMASNAPAVILPVGIAASRAWKLPTWDKHMIPKPFARVHLHMAAPLRLPSDIPKNEMAHWLQVIEEAIEAAEREAERHVD
jgi:lysophospholipid acyltransferase (LPLAT)-like uncharacterized protein